MANTLLIKSPRTLEGSRFAMAKWGLSRFGMCSARSQHRLKCGSPAIMTPSATPNSNAVLFICKKTRILFIKQYPITDIAASHTTACRVAKRKMQHHNPKKKNKNKKLHHKVSTEPLLLIYNVAKNNQHCRKIITTIVI